MNAEIITIGDEILIGQIIDTNSAYISKALNKIGVSVYQITSIQDDKQHILKALQQAENNANIIIVTGGLGPTKDDITKHTICEYFEDTLVQDEAVLDNIKHLWKTYLKRPLQQVNIDQALVPTKAIALMNFYGSAPGIWMQKGNKVFVFMPGVPFEMKQLLDNEVVPKLRQIFKFPFILHKTMLTYGLGESLLAERIANWENNLPPFIKLAYLPSLGKVRLRLSAKGKNKAAIETEVEKQIKLVMPLISDVFVGFENEDSIETLIGKHLVAQGKTLAVAESCTGGNISQAFTANAGASQYFKGSVVCYATQTKIEVLGVSKALIDKHSVVSQQVAEAMAKQVQKLYKTHYAISTTGNAGPTKGDSDAEVGTIWLTIAKGDRVYSKKFKFSNERSKTIGKATNMAMQMLLQEVVK